MPNQKLSKNSPAIQLLLRKFEAHEITGEESPKSVWQSEGIFQQHRLNTFRVHYNALRKEYQQTKESGDLSLLRPRCSRNYDEPSAKKARTENVISEDQSSNNEDAIIEKKLKEPLELTFSPLHVLSVQKEHDTMTRRVTVAIVLPSGVGSGDFSLRVVGEGHALELCVRWPRPLLDLQLMHKKWLNGIENYQVYHPEYIGFQDSLKLHRARSSDWIESIAKISLPCTVETHIHDKHNLQWKDNSNTRMLYVRLKAVVEQYTVQNDNDTFEML